MFMSETDNNLSVDDKIGRRSTIICQWMTIICQRPTIIDKILVGCGETGEWRCK